MNSKQRLIDLYELVNQVVESLLVVEVGASLTISFEVLSEHLTQVFVKLLRVLVFGEVLLVVFYQFLYLLLQLLVRYYILSGVVLTLILVSHVLVHSHVARIILRRPLPHAALAIRAILGNGLPVVVAARDAVVAACVLTWVLLVYL